MLKKLYEILKSEGCDINNHEEIEKNLCVIFEEYTFDLMMDIARDEEIEEIDVDFFKNPNLYYEDLLNGFLDELNVGYDLDVEWDDLEEFNNKYKDIICNYLKCNSERIVDEFMKE